ncbi:MAG: heme biosynthesis protein HemY [Xanthobacteraceae bacterium]
MIRVVLFLVVVGAVSLGAAWLVDRPGDVIITWQGWRIETSVMVLIVALLVALAVLALIFTILRGIWRSPFIFANSRRHRRGLRAYEAISHGLIAVGSGDVGAAQKHAAAVNRLAPGEPLALLLAAQSAQLAGDREGADSAFRAMASRTDTKPLGLHGLFVEAHRRNDPISARAYAEEAARTAPSLGWASRAVLEARCKDGDWAGALALLERAKSALDRNIYRRHRAVMLTAHAQAVEETDRDKAKALSLEAVKLAPTLVPAAAIAGRMLAEGGELRKASRIVAKAWRANPHQELAQIYADLRFGDAARDRLARVEALVKKASGGVEGALARARAALEAGEFGKARTALAPHLAAPTKRIALLMAELERVEHNDEGRAREWLARALHAAPDPQWTADGHVSDRWLPVSPITGRLDAFEWRVPLTGVVSTSVIEPEPEAAAGPRGMEPLPIGSVEALQQNSATEPPPQESKDAAVSVPADGQASPPSTAPPVAPRQATAVEPVIPLVHAPDDPGPEDTEAQDIPDKTQSGGWRKIFE